MKITRYFQSCLLVEEGQTRILIDPSGQEANRVAEFGEIHAVLYSHEHSDHFDPELAGSFMSKGVAVYANASTAKQFKEQPNVAQDGQEFEINDIKIRALELPHCLMWDGSAGPQNTGYLINQKLFHAGDGKELEGLKVEALAVPINGPDVSFKDAFAFCKQVSAKDIVPIHYDYLGGNPEVFASIAKDNFDLKVHVLKVGGFIEI